MAKKKAAEKKAKLSAFTIVMSVVSYMWVLFVIPLLTMRKNEFVHYHARQGMAFFLATIALGIFALIPYAGIIAGSALFLVMLVFWVIAIINALMGKKWRMPVIGGWADSLDL